MQGCPSTGLADGLFVEVHGSLTSTGLAAKSIKCEMESAGSTIERSGVASGVDSIARTFVLSQSGGANVGVKWSDTTFFEHVTSSTLAGKALQVQGQLVAGFLIAAKVELKD